MAYLSKLGDNRAKALMRVWAAIWAMTFGALVSTVFGIVALVWGIVDVLLELILNRDGLSASNPAAQWTVRSLDWLHEQSLFVIVGTGGFEWLP